MKTQLIARHFAKIGARAEIRLEQERRRSEGMSIDIGRDIEGEYFEIVLPRVHRPEVRVLDIQPQLRHLLLMSDQDDGKHKFLCGHDERHWFVAAVPERASASNVRTAFDALKPNAVHAQETRLQVKPRKRNRRRNEAFIRQGEWFFVPVPDLPTPGKMFVLRNEPIARGGGKPHMCEELVRRGGEMVYVCPQFPNGLTQPQYRRLLDDRPHLRKLPWNAQRRNPQVFVRGKVRHADHKTTVLNGWHQVLMNTQTQSLAMRHVAFVD